MFKEVTHAYVMVIDYRYAVVNPSTDMKSYRTRINAVYMMHEERLDCLNRVEWAEWILRYIEHHTTPP